MRLFGLIGHPLAQSFSQKYFASKFLQAHITDAAYELFEVTAIEQLSDLLKNNPSLCGLNVTIPYKQAVIPFLHSMNEEAIAIGACNCIKITQGILKGYNTDAPAFEHSLLPLLQSHHTKALVLGTGGAAKAVVYVLNKLGIENKQVSRTKNNGACTYEELTKEDMQEYLLIVNTTPLGSFPATDAAAPIPYEYLTSQHYLYDLVYNPPLTLFLQKGKNKGASIQNGYDMLVGQAERSWAIWNK